MGVPVPQQTSKGSPIAQEVPDHSWADSEAEAGGGGGGSGCEVLTVPWATQTHPVAFTHTITHTQSHPHSRTSRHALIHTCLPANQFLLVKWEQSPKPPPPLPAPSLCSSLGPPTAGRRTTLVPALWPPATPGHPPWLVYRLRTIDPLWLPACSSSQWPLLGACQPPSTP